MTNYKFVKDCNVPEAPTAPIVVPNDSPINPLVTLPTNPAVPLELLAKFLPCKNKNRYPCPTITVEDTVGADGTTGSTVVYNCVDEADLDIDFDIESYCCDVVEDDDGNTVTSDKIIMTPKVELSLPYPAIITKGWLHYFNKTGVDAYITSYNSSHTDQISICERCWTFTHVTAAKNYSATPLYKIWYFQSKSKDPDENPQKSYLVPVVDIEDAYITDATWHTENDKVLGSIDRCSCTASILNDYDEYTPSEVTVLKGNGLYGGNLKIYGVRAYNGTTLVTYSELTLDENSFTNIPVGASVSVDIKCPTGTTTTSDLYVTATGYTVPAHTGSVTASVSAGGTATVSLGPGETLYSNVTTVSAKNCTNRTILPGDNVCLVNSQGNWCFFDCAGDSSSEIMVSGVTNGVIATYNGENVFCEGSLVNPGYVFSDSGVPQRCMSKVALTSDGVLMYKIPNSGNWYIPNAQYPYSLDGGITFYKRENTIGQIYSYGYYPVGSTNYYFPVNLSSSTYCFESGGSYLDRTNPVKIYDEYGIVSNSSPTVGTLVLNTNVPGKHSISYTMACTSAGTATGSAQLAYTRGTLYAYGTINVTTGTTTSTYTFDTRNNSTTTEFGNYRPSGFSNGSTFSCTFYAPSISALNFKPYRYITEAVSYSSPVYKEGTSYYIDYNKLYRYKLTSGCLSSTITLKEIASTTTITKTFQEFIDNNWICQSTITVNNVSYMPVSNTNSFNLTAEARYSIPNVQFTASNVTNGEINAVVYKVAVEPGAH